MKLICENLFIFACQVVLCASGSYDYFSPDGIKQLWCPERCDKWWDTIRRNKCCACNSVPQWSMTSFSNISYTKLEIEHLDLKGFRSSLVSFNTYSAHTSYLSVIHTPGNLRKLPENICDFKIVTLDLTSNKITHVENMTCLSYLDTLILSRNLISVLSNKTFIGMAHLRKVDLSFNRIKYLDNNIFGVNGIMVFDVNLSGNNIKKLDFTNFLFVNKTACKISYKNNKEHMKVTNELNLQVDIDKMSPFCTDVDLSGNSMSVNPISSVTEFFSDYRQLYKYFPCGFIRMAGSGYNCDCKTMEFLRLNSDDFNRLYNKEKYEFYCVTPSQLANMSITSVGANASLQNLMVCEISDYCHSRPHCKCRCITQPSLKRLLVDCSNQTCTDLPEIVPDSIYGITLLMQNNDISHVNIKNYFNRIEVLDLSGNRVNSLGENIDTLAKATKIILYDHQLQSLPRQIQNLNPNIFLFQTNGIPCNCENIWIGEWMKIHDATHSLYCLNYPHNSIEYYVDHIAECESDKSTHEVKILMFLAITVTVIFLFVLIHYFWLEILLFRRRLQTYQIDNEKMWDIYFSFDAENVDVRTFVLELEKMFLSRKLTSFIPIRDSIAGHTREDSIINNIRKCKYVLIIHSEEMYMKHVDCVFYRLEYNYAWRYFLNRTFKRIFVLNFDSTRPPAYMHRQSRALYRFGLDFVVSNRKQSLYKTLFKIFDESVTAWS